MKTILLIYVPFLLFINLMLLPNLQQFEANSQERLQQLDAVYGYLNDENF